MSKWNDIAKHHALFNTLQGRSQNVTGSPVDLAKIFHHYLQALDKQIMLNKIFKEQLRFNAVDDSPRLHPLRRP